MKDQTSANDNDKKSDSTIKTNETENAQKQHAGNTPAWDQFYERIAQIVKNH